LSEEVNVYEKGSSNKEHLNSIFVEPRNADDRPPPPKPDKSQGREDMLRGYTRGIEVGDHDENPQTEHEPYVVPRANDKEELKTYWGFTDIKSVDLEYTDSPDFSSADSMPAFLKSPFCPNLVPPRITNATRGAFTSDADNDVTFSLPNGADPTKDRFGIRRAVSNRNNGSLKSPSDFVNSIKANAINPPVLPVNRVNFED